MTLTKVPSDVHVHIVHALHTSDVYTNTVHVHRSSIAASKSWTVLNFGFPVLQTV